MMFWRIKIKNKYINAWKRKVLSKIVYNKQKITVWIYHYGQENDYFTNIKMNINWQQEVLNCWTIFVG